MIMTEWRTSDLYLSAYLRASNVRFVRADTGVGKKLFFVFLTTEDEINALKESWFAGGTINALAYANEIKNLKSLLSER